MIAEPPSEMILDQRVRNRIIEYLQCAASFQKQVEYDSHHVCNVPNEMINQWEDWVHGDLADYGEPVYSPEEQAAIRDYQAVWLAVIDDTPNPLPDLETMMTTAPWERLRGAAEATLQVFSRRGRFDEDREIFGS